MDSGYIFKLIVLIIREAKERDFFNPLQERSSQDDYGTTLGRMICFYLRLLQLEEEDELGENQDILNWFQRYGLNESQKTSLQDLSEAL